MLALRQGHLDGLCGIYSVLNAANHLCGLTDEDRNRLFRQLVSLLEREDYLAKALYNGTYKKHIDIISREAIVFLEDEYNIVIQVKRLFRDNKKININGFWAGLKQFLNHQDEGDNYKRVAIIRLGGEYEHWTCVYDVKNSLQLIDSDGLKRINKSRCTLGHTTKNKIHRLFPSQAWGFRIREE